MVIIPNLGLSNAQPILVLEIIELPTKKSYGQRICDIMVVVTSRPNLASWFWAPSSCEWIVLSLCHQCHRLCGRQSLRRADHWIWSFSGANSI